MLTGIKAFEACWAALKQTYPTSKAENTLLVQSMGQFVDQYATRAEIREALPDALKALFDRLIEAYLNGYDPNTVPETAQILVGVTASQSSSPAVAMKPQVTSATGEPSTSPARITAATMAAASLRHQTSSERFSRSEADTLIVDEMVLMDD